MPEVDAHAACAAFGCLVGKWKKTHAEGGDALMKAQGVPWMIRKVIIAASTNLSCSLIGNTYTVAIEIAGAELPIQHLKVGSELGVVNDLQGMYTESWACIEDAKPVSITKTYKSKAEHEKGNLWYTTRETFDFSTLSADGNALTHTTTLQRAGKADVVSRTHFARIEGIPLTEPIIVATETQARNGRRRSSVVGSVLKMSSALPMALHVKKTPVCEGTPLTDLKADGDPENINMIAEEPKLTLETGTPVSTLASDKVPHRRRASVGGVASRRFSLPAHTSLSKVRPNVAEETKPQDPLDVQTTTPKVPHRRLSLPTHLSLLPNVAETMLKDQVSVLATAPELQKALDMIEEERPDGIADKVFNGACYVKDKIGPAFAVALAATCPATTQLMRLPQAFAN
mgnify:CR=1 FL=1